MKRIIAAFIAAALVFATMLTTLSAAEAGQFLQGYQIDIENEHLQILCADLEDGVYTVSLDGTELNYEYSTVSDNEVPITVYCLVDVSNSMTDSQITQVKDALTAISGLMGNGDGMVIATLGANTVPSSLLTSEGERESAISAIKKVNETTNLYAGMVDSLDRLMTDTSYSRKRCLVVLSDGGDYHDAGYTEREVIDKITESHLPVYTVATLPDFLNDMVADEANALKEDAKRLGSYARGSVGGAHSTPVVDGISANEAGEAIWSSLMSGGILDIDLSGLSINHDKTESTLRATYTSGDTKLEDTIIIYTVDLPASIITTDDTDDISDKPIINPPKDDDIDEPVKKDYTWLILIIAAVIIAVVSVIVIIMVLKNKPAETEVNHPVKEKSSEKKAPELVTTTYLKKEPGKPARPKPSGPPSVTMTAIGHSGKVFKFAIDEQMTLTVGRNPGVADIIPDADDVRLSGEHCRIVRSKGKLYVEDKGSTNGSFMNGIPIMGKGWIPIESGNTLRIGTNEYRVSYRFESDK